MYPNYPHDAQAQAIDTSNRAVEGDSYHVLLQSGSFSLLCAANSQASQTVKFPRPFTESAKPDVMVCLKSIGNTASAVKYLVAASSSNAAFTVQLLTDTTQTIEITWFAKGYAG